MITHEQANSAIWAEWTEMRLIDHDVWKMNVHKSSQTTVTIKIEHARGYITNTIYFQLGDTLRVFPLLEDLIDNIELIILYALDTDYGVYKWYSTGVG